MDTERLMYHAKCSSWKGICDEPHHQIFTRNPRCGDQVSLTLIIAEGLIKEARFQGQGCIVSQSCTSMLCENIEGKAIDTIISTDPEILLEYEFSELTPLRQTCALLAVNALVQYLKNTKNESQQ